MYGHRLRVKGTGQRQQGTGWFVDKRLVVTAFHVVGNKDAKLWWQESNGRRVSYVLDIGNLDIGRKECKLLPLCFDDRADVALLECADDPGDPRVLRLADAIDVGDQWHALGFPPRLAADDFPLGGEIENVNENKHDKAIALFVKQGTNVVWDGVSGSAVRVGSMVAGVITNVTTGASTAWAATVTPVRRLLGLYRASLKLPQLLLNSYQDAQDLNVLYKQAHDLCLRIGANLPPPARDREELVEQIRRAALRSGAEGFSSLLDAVAKARPQASVGALRSLLQTAIVRSPWRYEDLIAHWLPRARGSGLGSAWYFTGREEALREIVQWLKAPDSGGKACVVTGSPGTGKSALLARLVILSVPEYRAKAEEAGSLEGVISNTIPPAEAVSVAINAKGKTLGEVVGLIAQALQIEATEASLLVEELKANVKRPVILLDSLDEAQDPKELARELLAKVAILPNVWLLVGSRPTTEPGRLAIRVGNLGSAVVEIDLDQPHYTGAGDIAQYVTNRLLAPDDPLLETPYRGQPKLAQMVSVAVAKRAGNNFLVARTVSDNLTYQDKPQDVTKAAWEEGLPGNVRDAFDEFLDRFNDPKKNFKLGQTGRNRFA
jgi:trypsin-like peptidase/AAA ATPase-like protein